MKFKILLSAFVLTALLMGCSSDGEDDLTTPSSGNISGSVNLYDEGTTPSDKSGMKVTATSATTSFSATTDANGAFSIPDVPYGTYTLLYEKSGYGTYKRFNLQHTDTGTGNTPISDTPSLGASSTTQIPNLESRESGGEIILSITTNPAGNNANTRYIRYFLHSDLQVSSENYTFYSPGTVSRINPLDITLTQKDLIDAGFSSGQTVYARAYGDSFWSNAYEDPELGRFQFPNLNGTSSNFVSFVVP